MSSRDNLTLHTTGGSLPDLGVPTKIPEGKSIVFAFFKGWEDLKSGYDEYVTVNINPPQGGFLSFPHVRGIEDLINRHFPSGVRQDKPIGFISCGVVVDNRMSGGVIKSTDIQPNILQITSMKRLKNNLKDAFIQFRQQMKKDPNFDNPLVLRITRSGKGPQTQYAVSVMFGIKVQYETNDKGVTIYPHVLDTIEDLPIPFDTVGILEQIASFKDRRANQ